MIIGESSSKVYSFPVNLPAVRLVPNSAKRILDLGCGTGENSKFLKQLDPSRWIVGVSLSPAEAQIARETINEVIIANVETWEPPLNTAKFDCIFMCHVLEHLVHPNWMLDRVGDWLAPGGCIVIAVPNVVYVEQRVNFLRGDFRPTTVGILDNTHLHFFDHATADDLVRDSGFEIDVSSVTAQIPVGVIRWKLPKLVRLLDHIGERCWPNLFGWQLLIRAFPCKREVLPNEKRNTSKSGDEELARV